MKAIRLKWFEDYSCGCVSQVVERKKDLPGYCEKHGNDRRQAWPYRKEWSSEFVSGMTKGEEPKR